MGTAFLYIVKVNSGYMLGKIEFFT